MRDASRTDPPPVAPAGTGPLALLVTGDAPRSNRARIHLQEAIRDAGLPVTIVDEIDLLRDPLVALRFRVFATPALVAVRDDRATAVLYGDLSDPEAVRRFLLEVAPAHVVGDDGEPDGGDRGGRAPGRSDGRPRSAGG